MLGKPNRPNIFQLTYGKVYRLSNVREHTDLDGVLINVCDVTNNLGVEDQYNINRFDILDEIEEQIFFTRQELGLDR